MRPSLFLLCLLAAIPLPAQGWNEKIFYSGQTSASVRDSSTQTDRIFFMQPAMARYGHGRGSGFRGVLQDENQQTSETIRLSFVRYAADNVRPGAVISEVTYTIFGTGTGRAAYRFTFTLATRPALPTAVGIGVTLAPPGGWPQDGVSIHYQNGDKTRLPGGVTKPQWTWRRTGTQIQSFAPAASTLLLGGLYEEGVIRVLVSTTAYGSRQDLYGPEALYPDPARGDRVGFSLSHDGFKNQLGLVLLSPAYATPVSLPPFGTLLVNLVGSVFGPAMSLDANGDAQTATLPIPSGLRFAAQGVFLTATSGQVRLGDASRIEGR